MQVTVHFYSYLKDLTGCPQTTETLTERATIGDLLRQLSERFPELAGMNNSMLIAVRVEYQDRAYVLKEGDVVSLFPPVQGG